MSKSFKRLLKAKATEMGEQFLSWIQVQGLNEVLDLQGGRFKVLIEVTRERVVKVEARASHQRQYEVHQRKITSSEWDILLGLPMPLVTLDLLRKIRGEGNRDVYLKHGRKAHQSINWYLSRFKVPYRVERVGTREVDIGESGHSYFARCDLLELKYVSWD